MKWLNWLWKRKSADEKNVVVLIDYLNTVLPVNEVLNRKILDFDALREKCVEFGKVIFAFVFFPENYTLPSYIHDKGFYPLPCPPKNISEGKEKDRVDTIMAEVGTKFLEHSNIDVLVIVARDGDFIRLANYAKFCRKKLVIIAGEKTSYLLKKLADTFAVAPLSD